MTVKGEERRQEHRFRQLQEPGATWKPIDVFFVFPLMASLSSPSSLFCNSTLGQIAHFLAGFSKIQLLNRETSVPVN
jgi:hypothetical protein